MKKLKDTSLILVINCAIVVSAIYILPRVWEFVLKIFG